MATNERILWGLITGFLLGVGVRSFVAVPWPYAVAVLIAGIICVPGLWDKRAGRAALVAAVVLVSFGAGMIRMEGASRVADTRVSALLGRTVTLHGYVSAEPDVREGSVRLTVDVSRIITASSSYPVSARILVVAPAHTDIQYGSGIVAKGKLELPKSFDTAAGRTFNYPMYLAKDGILHELSFASVQEDGTWHGNIVQSSAISVKHAFIRGLQNAIPEPAAGLAGGITVGDKRSVGTDLSGTFQRVSLIHMVVLSGYNITVVINAVRYLTQWVPRLMQYGGITFAVIFVVLMTGGAASALRAGIMALVAVYARSTGRVFIATRVLGTVCLGMVVWNPYTLAFDPSFQLSVLATLGLVLFTPVFEPYFTWVPAAWALREIMCSTLATQTMVLPLLLYQNGTLSIVALPANIFALIAVPAAMLASFFAAIAGMTLGPLSVLVGYPAFILLSYIIKVAQFFAALPFAAVTVPPFGFAWVIVVYCMLGVVYYRCRKKEERPMQSAALGEDLIPA